MQALTKTKSIHTILLGTAVVSFVFFVNLNLANAFVIEDTDGVISNDFVLQPGKTELFISPGEKTTKNISITNRTNKTISFNVTIEDFVGSHEKEDTVVLLGNKESSYSLKNYLIPEINSFTLETLQKITIPITASIPLDAEPTGLYGAVIVSNKTSGENDTDKSQTRLVSRLGSLFFIKVAGDVIEEGSLEDFRISGAESFLYDRAEFDFEILFQNKGNVHLIPYGVIEIRNIFGSVVDTLEIDPYFALPDATRFRIMSWDGSVHFGRYSATILLNRGYEDIIDEKNVAVWIFPWKFTLGAIIVLLAIFISGRFFRAKFEVRKRS